MTTSSAWQSEEKNFGEHDMFREVLPNTSRVTNATHPGRVRRGYLIDLPHKVLEVGYVPLPIVSPVVSRVNNQQRLPPIRIVGRPRITVLLVGGAAVRGSRAGHGTRLLETIVPNVGKLERRVGAGFAGYGLGEVGHDARVQADAVALSQDAREAYGLGHGRVISHEDDAFEA